MWDAGAKASVLLLGEFSSPLLSFLSAFLLLESGERENLTNTPYQSWDPATGLGTPNYPKLKELFLSLP
jgi:hypothetical protein